MPSAIMGFPTMMKNVRDKRNGFSVFILTVSYLRCFSLGLSVDSCVTLTWILDWTFGELMNVPSLCFLQRVNDAQNCVVYLTVLGTKSLCENVKLFDNVVLWNIKYLKMWTCVKYLYFKLIKTKECSKSTNTLLLYFN